MSGGRPSVWLLLTSLTVENPGRPGDQLRSDGCRFACGAALRRIDQDGDVIGEPRLTVLLEELTEALGGDERTVLTEHLDRFAEPARGPAGNVDLVLAPASTEQVQVMIRWARTHRISLIPQGANSGLVEASTPGPLDVAVVLTTDRLVGEIVVNPIDRTAIVPAGVRLSTLNEELARHGLRLPIDLGADPSIGGMAATNTGGARMIRHGDMRSHLLGIEAVLADEEASVVDEISTLRKDNSGLSLTQLLAGSGGSLGVITRVALEVEPLAASTACAWLIPRDEQAVIDSLILLESRWGSHLSAFEVVSMAALETTLEQITGLHDPFANATAGDDAAGAGAGSDLRVLVEFETLDPEPNSPPEPNPDPGKDSDPGRDAGLNRDLRRDPALVSSGGVGSDSQIDSASGTRAGFDAGLSSADSYLLSALESLDDYRLMSEAVLTPPHDAWRLRHSISEGLRRSGSITGFDVSVPRSQLPAFRQRARAAVADRFPRTWVADFGHWGDGGIHCSVIVPFDDPLSDDEREQLRSLVFGIAVEEFGGSFSAEHGVGPVNADWWRRWQSPGSQRLSHAIKAACDPLGILGHPRMPY